jgi:TRAP-type C4-dicarboxylate transport system permease small subunit
MKILRAIDKLIDILCKAAILFAGALLMAMAINITYGVIARYAFSAPSVYAMELTKILMIPALVFAVAYVQRYDRHLKVDFLSNRFPERVRHVLGEIVVPIAGLFVGYVMVWKGWESMLYSRSINEVSYSSWAEPLWLVRLAIPVGYAILCLVLVAQLCHGLAALFVRGAQTTDGSETMVESGQV